MVKVPEVIVINMSYVLIQAVREIRNITRAWMARVMLCILLFDKKFIITIVIIFLLLGGLLITITTVWNDLIHTGIADKQYDGISTIDIIIYIIIFIFISSIIWIYNKNNKISLMKEIRSTEIEHMVRVGELACGIIHDIMNPLTSISLHMEELSQHKERYCPEKTYKMLAGAIEATRRMNNFMQSTQCLIDPKRKCEDTVTDLNKEVSIIRDIFFYKARMSNVYIDIDIPEHIIIVLNPMLINRILINLISNAIDACTLPSNLIEHRPPKEIKIRAKRSLNKLIISISDNGCGIPPQQLKSLFSNPKSTKPHGTSIGLTSVYFIIKNELNGNIDIKSTEGVGTIFTLTIPLIN